MCKRWLARSLGICSILYGTIVPFAASANDKVLDTAEAGPFRLRVLERQSGLQFSANQGFGRVAYQSLELLHRGRPLALPTGHGKPQASLRAAWVLPDAAQPAVLVGGDAWVLVTERDGLAHTQVLSSHEAGAWQWVDTPTGPGEAQINRVRVQSAPLAMQGGRLLLLDQRVVLDVRSLRAQALALDVPAGYRLAEDGLLGSSPDGRALALLYAGASNSSRDALIVVASTERPERALLPLDLKPLSGLDHVAARPDLLAAHFSWHSPPGTLPRLALRPRPPAPWNADYLMGMRSPAGQHGPKPSFTLSPVAPSMLQAAVRELVAHADLEPAQALPVAANAAAPVRLRTRQMPLLATVRLDPTSHTLVVDCEDAKNPLWAEQLVRSLGEHLEAQLKQGALREHLLRR